MLRGAISQEVENQLDHSSFASRLLTRVDFNNEETPKHEFVHNGETRFIYPEPFEVKATFESGDLSIAALTEGMESLVNAMVHFLDTRLVKLLQIASDTHNTSVPFKTFTPDIVAQLRSQLTRWELQASTMLFNWNVWEDVLVNSVFTDYMDSFYKHELVLVGRIGQMFGMEMYTDGFNRPDRRCTERGEVFVLTSPQHLGSVGRYPTSPDNNSLDPVVTIAMENGKVRFEAMVKLTMVIPGARGVARAYRD